MTNNTESMNINGTIFFFPSRESKQAKRQEREEEPTLPNDPQQALIRRLLLLAGRVGGERLATYVAEAVERAEAEEVMNSVELELEFEKLRATTELN